MDAEIGGPGKPGVAFVDVFAQEVAGEVQELHHVLDAVAPVGDAFEGSAVVAEEAQGYAVLFEGKRYPLAGVFGLPVEREAGGGDAGDAYPEVVLEIIVGPVYLIVGGGLVLERRVPHHAFPDGRARLVIQIVVEPVVGEGDAVQLMPGGEVPVLEYAAAPRGIGKRLEHPSPGRVEVLRFPCEQVRYGQVGHHLADGALPQLLVPFGIALGLVLGRPLLDAAVGDCPDALEHPRVRWVFLDEAAKLAYARFGEVEAGMDALEAVERSRNGGGLHWFSSSAAAAQRPEMSINAIAARQADFDMAVS